MTPFPVEGELTASFGWLLLGFLIGFILASLYEHFYGE